MIVEVNLGGIGIYSNDPSVKCYEEDSEAYTPRIKPKEVLIVSPEETIDPLDEVMIITSNGEVIIKEFVSFTGDTYYLDDINHNSPRMRLSKTEIKSIWPIIVIDRRTKKLPRPLIPEVPLGYGKQVKEPNGEEAE